MTVLLPREKPVLFFPHRRAEKSLRVLCQVELTARLCSAACAPHRSGRGSVKAKIKAMKKHTMPVVATVITSSKSSSTTNHPCCRMVCQGAARPKGRDVLSIARIGIGNLEGVERRCDQIGRVDRLAVLFVG